MAKRYIFSTLTADQAYTLYEPVSDAEKGDSLRVPVRRPQKDVNGHPARVLVKGGHGVANKNLITPKGVMTELDDKQLEMLEQCPSFVKHREAGYIKVESRKQDPEKVAEKMEQKDKSAPKTPAGLKKEAKEAGTPKPAEKDG